MPEPGNPQSYNRYVYTLNNPIKYNDPSGHWFESVLDLASIAYDIYDIRQNGLNWTNGLSLAADVGSLALPVVTGGGLAVRALAHADDVADVVTHVDDAVDAGRAVETLVGVGQAADNVSDAAKANKVMPIAQRAIGETGQTYNRFNGQGTYALLDSAGSVQYIGRGDAPARLSSHAKDAVKGEFRQVIIANNSLSYPEARGLEEMLIREYRPPLNRISGISPRNPRITEYLTAGGDLFDEAKGILGR